MTNFHLFRSADIQANHVCYAYDDGKLLMAGDRLPTADDLNIELSADTLVFRLPHGWAIPAKNLKKSSFELRPLREALDLLPAAMSSDALLGAQLVNWSSSVRFCSHCGGSLKISNKELAKVCDKCTLNFHPQLTPAIIVLVKRGRELLLAKGPAPRNFYSCIAGFVEPGETLEDCIRREVREEVKIEVRNIKYFGSQPWPFPNNLMIGFTAEWVTGEIEINPEELADAGWYTKDNLPPIVPLKVSIARQMIEAALRT